MFTKDEVYSKVVEILDSDEETKGLRVCMDLMEEARKRDNLEEAAMVIVDDSMYWAGMFC